MTNLPIQMTETVKFLTSGTGLKKAYIKIKMHDFNSLKLYPG